jgi:hypothetical protein
MKKKLYLSTALDTEKDLIVGVGFYRVKLNWADGMIGALAVFASSEEAKAYCGGRAIYEIEVDQ